MAGDGERRSPGAAGANPAVPAAAATAATAAVAALPGEAAAVLPVLGGATAGRLWSIEMLRIVGALGIVMFHLQSPGGRFGYAALPMFIYLSVFFALRHGSSLPLKDFTRTRFDRLLAPWIFWSLVFVALKFAQAWSEGHSVRSEFAWWQLFTGPALHLWFLPFIAVVSIALRLVWKYLAGAKPAVVLIAAVGLSAGLTFVGDPARFGPPLEEWVFGLVPVLMAVADVRTSTAVVPGQNRIALLLWMAMLLARMSIGTGSFALPLFVSVVGISAAGTLSVRLTSGIRAMAGLSLGVYILHPMVAAALSQFGANPWNGSLAMLCLVYGLTLVATAAAQRTPIVRRFV